MRQRDQQGSKAPIAVPQQNEVNRRARNTGNNLQIQCSTYLVANTL